MTTLSGKKGLIIGIANEHSLAYGCARHFRAAGAELAITYINAKTEPYVRPLAQALQSEIFMPCDVTAPGQLEAVYGRIAQDWGRLDFVQHSIAYARKEDLSGRITDCSAEGFPSAMNVSVHSFLRVAKLSEPLMTAGGCLLAMSYYGAEKAIAHYNVMGTVKAALEAAVRYMALELGQAGIRVNALSPGPRKNSRGFRNRTFRRAAGTRGPRGARAQAGYTRRRWRLRRIPCQRRRQGDYWKHCLCRCRLSRRGVKEETIASP